MKIIREPFHKEEFRHVIKHDDVKYVREECIMGKDFHTISWRLLNDEYEELIEYYSKDGGWSKDNKCHPSNPIPEIEQIFQDKYGINVNKNIPDEIRE